MQGLILAALMASTGDQAIWTLELKTTGETCQVTLQRTGQPKASPVAHLLPALDCKEARALVPDAAKDLARKDRPAPSLMTDEPRYTLKIRDTQGEVAFKAPEECEIRASGNLDCKTVPRSPAEKLVTLLRNAAVAAKRGNG